MEFNQIAKELASLTPTVLFQIFAIAQALDIASGFIVAKINGDFQSRVAVNGIMRQGLRLSFFVASLAIQKLIGADSLTLTLLITSYQVAMIIGYAKSLYENYEKLNKEDVS